MYLFIYINFKEMEAVEHVIYNYSHFRNFVTPCLEMLTGIHLKFVEIQRNSCMANCFAHWQG
jgi:hypothetical protein